MLPLDWTDRLLIAATSFVLTTAYLPLLQGGHLVVGW